MASTKATARVQVTVEVVLSQPWGGDATVDYIRKRAEEEALDLLRSRLSQVATRIHGDPKVIVVLVEDSP